MGYDGVNKGDWALDDGKTKAVASDSYGVVQDLRDLDMQVVDESVNISYFNRNHDLNETVVSVSHLRQIVNMLERANFNNVLIEAGNDTPIQFSAHSSENLGTNFVATLAPLFSSDLKERHRNAQLNLAGFETKCIEDDCDWSNNYENEEEALEAGHDHKYYTGHDFVVYDPLGEKVSLQIEVSGDEEE